ncbi:MFS transporter [Streptacidiphilus rugosus]|uniref:MFS transporter n=1 Tax=Streptacidiphilus rugosus TaxID=405783 RepID=UPI000AA7E284|nr:MFS transporter [Streptacidiphilus rugosus]
MSTAPGSLWRHRDFLLLWAGGATSDLGSALSTLLIPLIAVQGLRATTLQVAVLGLTRRLPAVVVALPAGVLVDRTCRRPLMIACDLLSLLAIATVPVVAWAGGRVPLWQLYTVTAVIGAVRSVFDIADQSVLPSLVGQAQLVDANGKLRLTETGSDTAGPALGALLAGAFGAAKAVAADAVSYAVSAATLLAIRTPEPAATRPNGPRVTFRAAMREGMGHVRRDPVLRAVAATTATANLGILAVISLEVVYLIRQLHASPTQVGLVLGAGIVGGVVGSTLAKPVAQRLGPVRAMWVPLVVCTPFALLMPLAAPGWGLILYSLGWAVFNAGGSVYQAAQMAYRQAACPPELLGRVNAALRWIVWSTMPLGALLGGVLGTWIGLRPTLWLATTALACTGLWLTLSPAGHRTAPTT